jgi:signal peptidase II
VILKDRFNLRFYKPTRNTAIAFAVAALLVGLDLLTKFFAVEYLKPLQSVNLITIDGKQVLNLTYVENTGAAFSLFEGMRWLLIGAVLLYVLAALFMIFTRLVRRPFTVWSLCLVIAGGVGNGIGRVADGYVVDFIDFRIINFAIFNVADMCAVIGAIALFIFVVADTGKDKKTAKAGEQAATENAEDSYTETENDADMP